MTVMLILIVISFTLAISFLTAFLWAVKNNQYEDTFTPSLRILMDSEEKSDENNDLRINQVN
jgi:cbb3-type cytochrome oxidase maturation protein